MAGMDADQRVDAALHRWLRAHSIIVLRVVLGVVILAFGVLKFFPDVSPAEELTIKTTDKLSFGLVPGHIAIVVIASLETIIGLLLITGRFLRVAIYLLFGQLIGILAPLALFTDRLFAGPHNAPTLEGQYVIKDLILVASGFVVASTLPGLVPGSDPDPSARQDGGAPKKSGARTDWTDWSAVRG
jgi:putative oxidoreductase